MKSQSIIDKELRVQLAVASQRQSEIDDGKNLKFCIYSNIYNACFYLS